MRKNFSFIYPVTKRHEGLHRIGTHVYDHVADLVIKGVAYITNANVLNNISHKYKFDINEILLDGKNLYPHPEVIESIENIKAACLNHIEQMMESGQEEQRPEPLRMYPALAKVITLPLKRKVL